MFKDSTLEQSEPILIILKSCMKNSFLQTLKYILFDAVSAAAAWILFFYYRSVYIDGKSVLLSNTQIKGVILITLSWIVLYAFLGFYKNIYRKSRLKELGQTFSSTLLGVTILFFAVLIDDFIVTYKQYYFSYLVLFAFHFGLTSVFRLLLSSVTAYRVHNKLIGFKTIIIGSNEKAVRLFNDLENEIKSSGHQVLGFVSMDEKPSYLLSEKTNYLGAFNKIRQIITDYQVEDIIIAIETSEHNKIATILNELENTNVFIKIIPDMYDILSGSVKMSSILGTPFDRDKTSAPT